MEAEFWSVCLSDEDAVSLLLCCLDDDLPADGTQLVVVVLLLFFDFHNFILAGTAYHTALKLLRTSAIQ